MNENNSLTITKNELFKIVGFNSDELLIIKDCVLYNKAYIQKVAPDSLFLKKYLKLYDNIINQINTVLIPE